jgi:hypothetical protein
VYESLEKDLVLVGISAIEDKLQVRGRGSRGDERGRRWEEGELIEE